MKIGILTFHAAQNYGAVLQCRCLYEVLRGLGHEVHVLDYRPAFLTEPYKLWKNASCFAAMPTDHGLCLSGWLLILSTSSILEA